MPDNIMLRASEIAKSYRIGKNSLEVLKSVNFNVKRGSWTALFGASGSGKTTLLNLLGALETPDRGTIICNGIEYSRLSSRKAASFRNKHIGFVFQSYHLLPELSILENVMLPGMFAGNCDRKRALELLERVGLAERISHRPAELSGGEQQRAAIARALINQPSLVLADEPTGNLDSHTGKGILSLFRELRTTDPELTIVMITHNPEIIGWADESCTLADGVLSYGV